MLDFPNSPAPGAVFGAYTWDGQKWTATGGGGGGGISDAPNDGVQYGRQSLGWTPVSGGSFLQAGTGAVTRTMQDKARDIISVKDFGAVGDGVANDTAAMQAAHNTGKTVYSPAGRYSFTPTIMIASGGIVGDGPTQTILISADATTANLIKYTGA